MLPLASAVRHYLHEVLGIPVPSVKPWARESELPYFLRDAFQFGEIEMLGQAIVLAMGRAEQKQSLSEVRTWLDKLRALAGQPLGLGGGNEEEGAGVAHGVGHGKQGGGNTAGQAYSEISVRLWSGSRT